MTEFLSTKKTASTIEEIITNAKERLVLISPYLKISQQDLGRLKGADRNGIHMQIVYREDKLQSKERKSLYELDNLELYSLKNLHAKCYCNERTMVITSLNYYETSEKNWEMGVLIDRQEHEDLYVAAMREVELILKESNIEKTIEHDQKSETTSKEEMSLQKEYEFESYIYTILCSQKEFTIEEWNTDKNTKIASSKKPDFIITFKPTNKRFAVECKYQSDFRQHEKTKEPILTWTNQEHIDAYKDYSSNEGVPVTVVIGVGGKPNKPEKQYRIPLPKAYPSIFRSVYKEHTCAKADKRFFLNEDGFVD